MENYKPEAKYIKKFYIKISKQMLDDVSCVCERIFYEPWYYM